MLNHQEELKKRGFAFLWHLGAMIGAATVAFTLQNLNLLDLPEWSVVLAGLVLGQVTKYLNNLLNA